MMRFRNYGYGKGKERIDVRRVVKTELTVSQLW
jgi:hypothetical protein